MSKVVKKNWYYDSGSDNIVCLSPDELKGDSDDRLQILGLVITGKKAEGAELLETYREKPKKLKYEDCKPIQPTISAVYLVTFCEIEKVLCVFHRGATVENIVDFIKVYYPERKTFTVRRIDVGVFVLAAMRHISMSGDGREINQDMEII